MGTECTVWLWSECTVPRRSRVYSTLVSIVEQYQGFHPTSQRRRPTTEADNEHGTDIWQELTGRHHIQVNVQEHAMVDCYFLLCFFSGMISTSAYNKKLPLPSNSSHHRWQIYRLIMAGNASIDRSIDHGQLIMVNSSFRGIGYPLSLTEYWINELMRLEVKSEDRSIDRSFPCMHVGWIPLVGSHSAKYKQLARATQRILLLMFV